METIIKIDRINFEVNVKEKLTGKHFAQEYNKNKLYPAPFCVRCKVYMVIIGSVEIIHKFSKVAIKGMKFVCPKCEFSVVTEYENWFSINDLKEVN